MKVDEPQSYLTRSNLEYLEQVYEDFKRNPESIDKEWMRFFEGIEFAKEKGLKSSGVGGGPELLAHELTKIYRDYGHLKAQLDPLKLERLDGSKEFEAFNDLGIEDVDQNQKMDLEFIGLKNVTLSELIDFLEKTYCQKIALQAAYCAPKAREWFCKEFESDNFKLTKEDKVKILKQLARTESLEKFIHTRYVGVKRFSIEGCDSLIPMLEHLTETATEKHGVEEITIGMAHRGRINVLANYMNKALKSIFAEFNGHMGAHEHYDADVKYHMGFSAEKETEKGKSCHVSLAFNPSHLEVVNSVVCGMARAKQRQRKDTEKREKVIPVHIHGDAAVIGQGVVAETFQLSKLKGYEVGGTIHIIMNNQVGFTTNPSDARSTRYASDIALSVKAPVILVNADDPEQCVRAMDMALRYRQEFKEDVIIDLIGYRRFGHNEGDEPAFTQPMMYDKIKRHPTVYKAYEAQLDKDSTFSKSESQKFFDSKIENLQQIYDEVKENPPENKPLAFGGVWEGYKKGEAKDFEKPVNTKAKLKDLKTVMDKMTTPPDGFNLHKKVQKLIDQRRKNFEEDTMDWGLVELLTYGSLIMEGTSVRLSGQDSIRGTFTHRHSQYFDTETAEAYSPLSELREDKEFCVYNSSLSEMAVLGFEYGNSITDPTFLTLWEAQFGDFANGAQIIIDQFITSGEAKWYRSNGLVLLLPHGYEGQGPEHSSARLERFLQMCAQYNIQVCNFTTPAQLFHGLRRQIKRDFRKPLIVMSPKSLLRHPKVISSKKDLTDGGFQEVLFEADAKAERVVFCSGKLYYDLLDEKESTKDSKVALVRVEQLYPYPEKQIQEAIKSFKNANSFVWAQEEPQNMGAYWFIAPKLKSSLKQAKKTPELFYAGRPEKSSPATGAPSVHKEEQDNIIKSCFNLNG
jgi:2-oxoglutarate dehydrogenase E1 component